jgi:hypothetical protein
VSQPRNGYYRDQPRRPSFTPTGFSSAGRRHGPPSGYATPQAPPPRRAPRKRLRKRNAVLLAIAAGLLIGIIASAVNGNSKPAKSLATDASSATTTPASATAKAEDACQKRPPDSGDIYVRMLSTGGSPRAQRLGGGWAWNHVSNKCLTSVQMVLATAPQSVGNCTQVGYVADNPGYDPNASPAAPLAHVTARVGPACQSVAPSTPPQATHAPTPPAPAQPTRPAAPAQPTSAAAPPSPPASTAPASCYPLSDEGTCYEPGEYCRDSDHGTSGVAGDGEAITCEDNDGWRWEPA